MVSSGDTAWVLVSAALVLFMTVGLAFFYGGLEPRRNVLNMLMMNFFTISIVTVVWILVGFSLAFAPDAGWGVIGNLHYALMRHMTGIWPGTHIPKLTFMLFQLMFAVITPALITGAIAGRVKFKAWMAVCFGWSLLVYPTVAHWLFDPAGWLYRLGSRDFAGGAVVHASAGAAALVLALMVGPRSQKSLKSYKPHSVPLMLLGAGILWFGWFGFNAGSALGSGQLAASAFAATQIAAATSSIVWALMEYRFAGKVTVVGVATGAVVGLATITPASGFVGPLAAMAIGAGGSLAGYWAIRIFQRFSRFDDSFDVVACHGVGGATGMLLLGVFAQYAINPGGLRRTTGMAISGLIFGHSQFLGDQLVAVIAVVGFTIVATYVIGLMVNATIGLRVSKADEVAGLNGAFDGAAYVFEEVALEARRRQVDL